MCRTVALCGEFCSDRNKTTEIDPRISDPNAVACYVVKYPRLLYKPNFIRGYGPQHVESIHVDLDLEIYR